MKKENVEERLNFMDHLSGDKVVWIIVLCLSLISLVSIFSSTSLMATDTTSRLDIVSGQFVTIMLGMAAIFLCFRIKRIKVFKFISKYAFAICFMMLMLLASHKNLGIVKAMPINGAWRVLKVAGFQVHVFEVAKVGMIMYLAWAVDTFKKDKFFLANLLSRHEKFSFLAKPIWKEVIYIYCPILITTLLVLLGGTSSALFIAMIMVATIVIGGMDFRHVIVLGVIGCGMIAGCAGLYLATRNHMEHPLFERIGTGLSRLHLISPMEGEEIHLDDYEKFMAAKEGSRDYYDALDKIRQPMGAKIAIHEGGIMGKGPGQSTQKYIVPVMYEDYMFSFIVEEYGLLGGMFVIMLYISLMARGSLIARNCDNNFAKIAVAGLCLLISGQGIFHVIINCDLGILTGQTLPLISHGTSSFLCFSVAFGIILSISRMASEKIEVASAKAGSLMSDDSSGDVIMENLGILDEFESNGEFTDNDIL
ncbi:MAG: FtsW/RodA/SpoVE family cell cycle protein [Bacteroidales bacterium]|nr:FtsW/RodA/SpoVE family cell cycle protein [Bacteroidales bacterium]